MASRPHPTSVIERILYNGSVWVDGTLWSFYTVKRHLEHPLSGTETLHVTGPRTGRHDSICFALIVCQSHPVDGGLGDGFGCVDVSELGVFQSGESGSQRRAVGGRLELNLNHHRQPRFGRPDHPIEIVASHWARGRNIALIFPFWASMGDARLDNDGVFFKCRDRHCGRV